MRLKSYFVHSVDEAIQRAKGELGGEAMLVDTKPLAALPGNRARVEVIFAAASQSPPPPPPVDSVVLAPCGTPETLTIERFRHTLTGLLDTLSEPPGSGKSAPDEVSSRAIELFCSRLVEAEVSAPLVRRLMADGKRFDPDLPTRSIDAAAILAAELPSQIASTTQPRRIAVLGPNGSGKSTVTAKLAYKLGLEKGIAPLVVSLDNIKIGASDQLSRLCRLLGVAFHSVECAGELQHVLEENEHRRLTLIDTPGLHQGDPHLAAELSECMNGRYAIERHLVMPASARFATMDTWFALAAPLTVDHLLFTRLDETALFGPMWSMAVSRNLPFSWVSSGPRIPEDIERADTSRICNSIAGGAFTQPPLRASAAHAGSSPT